MRIIAPVTDYIPKSILTTVGDRIIRGVAIPERYNKNRIPFDTDDLQFKQHDIGLWNMDTTDNVDVNLGGGWGLDTNLRAFSVMIYNDNGDDCIPLDCVAYVSPNVVLEGGISNFYHGVLTLYRRNGGIFDSTSYNSTGMNRGVIFYTFVD